MRAAIVLPGLVLLLLAGAASAGDAMLPVLLEGKNPLSTEPATTGEPVQGMQALPAPAAGSGVSFGIAAAAAALVTVAGLWWFGRREPAARA